SRQHENPGLPDRCSRKPEATGGRNRALTHAVAQSRAVSIVHGRLMRSASATAPVVSLTLAKWQTLSGRFGGYLIIDGWRTALHARHNPSPSAAGFYIDGEACT